MIVHRKRNSKGELCPRSQVALVPNNEEGRKFIKNLKKYLNDEKYLTFHGRGPREGCSYGFYGTNNDISINNPNCKEIAVYIQIKEKYQHGHWYK